MRIRHLLIVGAALAWPAMGQTPQEDAARALATLPAGAQAPKADDPALILTQRLDLEKYKAAIKGLTRFGDRRQGTQRNRDALDWIEARLKSYGCRNTERLTYQFGDEPTHFVRPVAKAGDEPQFNVGGARARGFSRPTGVNTDANAQPNSRVRALDTPPAVPGEREDVCCTKIGWTHPEEMYIVAAHMDGIGYGEAANDDGSGTALVMELARIFSDPACRPTVRSALSFGTTKRPDSMALRPMWSSAKSCRARKRPPGSGKYPEPKWLGMIQHDMMLFDHGMPHADGTMNKEQRPEADVNIEFRDDREDGRSRHAAGA